MTEKTMDLNLFGYYIIDNAIPIKITIEYHSKINLGNRAYNNKFQKTCPNRANSVGYGVDELD